MLVNWDDDWNLVNNPDYTDVASGVTPRGARRDRSPSRNACRLYMLRVYSIGVDDP